MPGEAHASGEATWRASRRVRLAWRWTESGTTGKGPWSHREDVVETLADMLNRRYVGRVEHWVESENEV